MQLWKVLPIGASNWAGPPGAAPDRIRATRTLSPESEKALATTIAPKRGAYEVDGFDATFGCTREGGEVVREVG
jgi:hypothetical protein